VPQGLLLDRWRHPTQLVLAAFTALVLVGTVLLRLPVAIEGDHPGVVDALFTSTSAVTVTGLGSFDVGRLSLFGELVVLGLVQVGGFGIMTIGSVLGLLASRRVGLRQRMLAQTEIGAVEFGEVRSLLGAIARITVTVEVGLALVLFLRLWQREAEPVGRAAYSGVFHAVTAYNNAGFSLYSDSLRRFVDDPWVCVPITFGIIIGGLGFPLLLVVAPLIVLVFEWTNPGTLGPLSGPEKVLAGWFQGVSPRTAGFETVPYGEMNEPTQTVTSALMFIGAGPASTSGGIKVTTFAVLGFVLWAEVRGDTEVNVLRRRISGAIIRQAVTVALLSIGVVAVTSLVLVAVEDVTLTPALFEATSAFGTVGLSTGLTTALSNVAKLLLSVVMLLGRVGPVTFITALALRERTREYRYPEERPIIG
jgi:trk system potassium uptake protein TrkH